jgi:hypothetical protein
MESISWLATAMLPLSLARNTRYHRGRLPLVAIRGAPSAGRRLLSGETNLAALFHFLCKVAHGVLRDVSSFAARKRGFGIIEGCQEFRSLALALFPQQQCLLNRISAR